MRHTVKIATTVAVLLAGTAVVAAQPAPREGGTPGAQSPTPGQKSGEPKAEPKAAPKAAEPKAERKAAPKAAEPKAAEPKAGPKAAPKAAEPSGGTPSTTITTEQRTQIRQTIISESNAPRVTNVNFSLAVGAVVPRTVRIVVLPPRVVEIYPAWRGYHYFLVGDRIVIVEPDTLRIVFIIDA
jgi:hypothetical protein